MIPRIDVYDNDGSTATLAKLRLLEMIMINFFFIVKLYFSISFEISDVDECKENPCNGACINFPGSYQCICDPGYELRDGRCEGRFNMTRYSELPIIV